MVKRCTDVLEGLCEKRYAWGMKPWRAMSLKRHGNIFNNSLAEGGTALQERIAENRLREIQEKTEALQNPAAVKPRSRRENSRK